MAERIDKLETQIFAENEMHIARVQGLEEELEAKEAEYGSLLSRRNNEVERARLLMLDCQRISLAQWALQHELSMKERQIADMSVAKVEAERVHQAQANRITTTEVKMKEMERALSTAQQAAKDAQSQKQQLSSELATKDKQLADVTAQRDHLRERLFEYDAAIDNMHDKKRRQTELSD
jgi:chromosome segregation ATPase